MDIKIITKSRENLKSEINLLVSGGVITVANARVLLGGIALEGARAGTIAAGTVSSSLFWGTFAAVITRALSLGVLLTIKDDDPPPSYYEYVIQGSDEIAKFGITKQSDPSNRRESQIE